MRKIFSSKTHLFVALLLAAALVFGFASCSSDSDDDDDDSSSTSFTSYLPSEFSGKTVSAIFAHSWTETETESGITYTGNFNDVFYFFSDGAYVNLDISQFSGGGQSETDVDPVEKGTYSHTGDFTNDTITMLKTHEWSHDSKAWKESSRTKTIIVENGISGTYTKQ